MVWVDIYGQMVESTVENGSITKCMELAYFLGVMAEFMLVSTLRTKNMVKEFLNGLMVENMWVFGKMENNMVKEYSLYLEHKENKENGKMVIEKDGLYLKTIKI